VAVVHPDPEGIMKRTGIVVASLLALAIAVPALAGGAYCSGGAHATTAWSGAWLERSSTGAITVAGVAKGSPAARSGLVAGDVVTAVNGKDIAVVCNHSSCPASSASACNVGSVVTYSVRHAGVARTVQVKLERMPVEAAHRFAHRDATFDPMLAALVMPTDR
jgi:S1-C subfamily serine protease